VNIRDILDQKNRLKEQLDQVQKELEGNKSAAINEIRMYIRELNISFIEMESIYRQEGLSVALIQVIKPKGIISETKVDRNRYVYRCPLTGRWYNGYTKLPKWFDLSKADTYVLPNKKHTPKIARLLQERGLNQENKPMAKSLTNAQRKALKEKAEQLEKLFYSNNLDTLAKKYQQYKDDIDEILLYCAEDVVEHVVGLTKRRKPV